MSTEKTLKLTKPISPALATFPEPMVFWKIRLADGQTAIVRANAAKIGNRGEIQFYESISPNKTRLIRAVSCEIWREILLCDEPDGSAS